MGGGEGARPLHPSPRSALLIKQGRTVATVHLAKQECLVKLFFSRRFCLQKYWNGYLYIRCQDWFILFTIYCSSCKYHAQVNDMQIHTKGLLFYWKLALIFKTTGIDVICGFYPKVRQKWKKKQNKTKQKTNINYRVVWQAINIEYLRERCFSSCYERETKRKLWIPMRKRTSDLRSDALLLSHRDSTVSEVYYEVHMTRVLHTARISMSSWGLGIFSLSHVRVKTKDIFLYFGSFQPIKGF